MPKVKVTLELTVSEETFQAIQEAKEQDPAFLETFVLLSIGDLAKEWEIIEAQQPGAIHHVNDPQLFR